MKRVLLASLRFYQGYLSPWLGNQCRFYPTCSEYARQAVEHHGALRGSALAARRLCKCHPWHPGGFDPVPGQPHPLQGDAQHDGPQQNGFQSNGPKANGEDHVSP
ncbi:hypothetical protein MA04_01688 [Alcanivorax balearicus MACL04]|uniref:Putative membrane protein insertion efficiency factor n=1 Tax=Alloalcanivorax balearicus MACL04 TaxID=1177182 RepID=A0ABT2QXZ2_9GAMM|nr:membrane protein insertion efficiency factor YidD [Alloalcanivorax balearicus]MCU5782388.1 hypothetical protein [Alloalcanivorax balearicus MACL04]